MEKESILITGGAGYLGCVLTGYLLSKGYRVTVIDSLMYANKSLFIYSSNPDFEFVYGDSRNRELLEKEVPKHNIIIPLAAIVGMPACNSKPQETEDINRNSILLINEIRTNNQKLIYPNTNSGYGVSTGEVYCTEETPLEPVSSYGKMKCEAEIHLLESEKDAITLRLATVFGISPRMRTDLLVNDFTLKAFRDGYIVIYQKDFKRNYIHVKDVARVFLHCIKNYETMKNKAYNVGLEDANLSKIDLAEKIKKYIPNFEIVCKEIGEDPDKRNYIVSNKRILSTGFKPKYSLDFGIKELIKGYKILLKNDPFQNV
ncbi:NAD(P)-dependent oxidoreductase [Candidatus Pacearchaeota archaeon]|nr:NAD(P)-dependent oxidoreductase [Candidatus Pacearchaeota archaeon]